MKKNTTGVRHVVVIGAGVIGCATAHYLRQIASEQNIRLEITVVDKVGVAAAASGRAGGFLARDWHCGPAAALAAQSFELHRKLAAEFANIGYRPCCALQPTCRGGKTAKAGLAWYDGCTGAAPEIAARGEAAQVIPTLLCEALFSSSGATLIVGTPSALHARGTVGAQGSTKQILSVTSADGCSSELPCDALLLACGPWTSATAHALDVPMGASVIGLKAHSVLLQPTGGTVDDSCLFVDWQGDPSVGELELYSRVDGVYVCGCGEEPRPVDEQPGGVAISKQASNLLRASATSISSLLKDATVLRETACYLPVASTGTVVAGKLRDGVYVATGHTCWGILNGPATGLGMAEIMLGLPGEGATLLAPFAPEVA